MSGRDGAKPFTEPDMRDAKSTFRLRHRGRDLLLGPGKFVIGRAPSSDVIVEDTLASRRHAVVVVEPEGVSIQDLGSINGVYVNGSRLGNEPRILHDGDRIHIGSDEIQFLVGEMVHGDDETTTLSGNERMAGLADEDMLDDELPGMPTHRVGALEVIGIIAEKALAMGRPQEAERLLGDHLAAVLRDAQNGRVVAAETRDRATRYAVQLATATGDGRWFDYLISLHHALSAPLPEWIIVDVQVALARVRKIDREGVQRYRARLEARRAELDSDGRRLLSRTEDVLDIAASKRIA